MDITDRIRRDMRAVARALALLKVRRARLEATIAAARLCGVDPVEHGFEAIHAHEPTLQRRADAFRGQPLTAGVQGFRAEGAIGVLIPELPRHFRKG